MWLCSVDSLSLGTRLETWISGCCLSSESFSLSSESFSLSLNLSAFLWAFQLFSEPFSLSLTKGRPHSHSMGRVRCELGMVPVIFPLCTHCTSLLATKLPLAILWAFCDGFTWERPSGKGCGSQGMCLVQTMDLPVTLSSSSSSCQAALAVALVCLNIIPFSPFLGVLFLPGLSGQAKTGWMWLEVIPQLSSLLHPTPLGEQQPRRGLWS